MLRNRLSVPSGLAASLAAGALALLPSEIDARVQDSAAAAAEASPALFIRAEHLIVRPGKELASASVLVREGRIVAVGTDLEAPEGAEVLEGSVVCAGFIDAWSRVGVDGGSYEDRGAGPAARAVDAVDPYASDHDRAALLAAGVVASRVQVGDTAPVGGVGAVVANDPDADLAGLVISGEACVSARVAGGDVFERLESLERIVGAIEQGARYRDSQVEYREQLVEWEKAIAEKTEELEEGFKKAKKERDKKLEEAEEEGEELKEEKYKEDRRPSPPRYDADSEVMARVATGELPFVIEAQTVAEIRGLLERMAKHPRVRWVLAGATDAHFLAEDLAEARVPVLIAPQRRGLGGNYGIDEFELAGRLQQAGVSVLLGSDGSSSGRDLPLMAALAAGYGLDRDAALAAITTAPARVFDLWGEAGTVEVGKRAHLVVLSGDPLASTSQVEAVVLSGEVVVRR
jgi:imidazolonepropionase-like amidohydrolase